MEQIVIQEVFKTFGPGAALVALLAFYAIKNRKPKEDIAAIIMARMDRLERRQDESDGKQDVIAADVAFIKGQLSK